MSEQLDGKVDVCVVIGIQGAGKSSRIENNQKNIAQPSVYFDTAFPAKKHLQRILEIAIKHSNIITAV